MRLLTPAATACLTCLVSLVALCLPTAAFAQYAWIDEKGARQYSDMPPPASVPQSRILKAPQGATQTPNAAGERDGGSASAPAEKAAPLTTAEQNADFNKRRAERVEQEKKAAEQRKLAADKSRNCERARVNQRAMQSGMRLAATEANGERAYLTDEQRARETADARRYLRDCK